MQIELLAPAGDVKSFDAAISSGADAVYLGLGDFNARMKAENFSAENLRETVKKAHFYGVKVYVTVNTILQNQEFNSLVPLVKACVLAKVDAFLVQDLGVAFVLKRLFPNIVLHASTQIGVHNLYGAKVAEKIGFKRVVLSRETKLEDIKAIKQSTNLEIEYFVQGALCIAFSGNCYMSAKEQGASGNRGLCKQLCRLPYIAGFEKNGKFEKAGEGHLLSARDLSLAASLKDLVDAGVTSFKIEGRLRREGYVAETVGVYRRLLDSIQKGDKASVTDEESERLKTSFARGEYLERAYLDEGTPFIVEKRFNGHIGVRVGVVKKVSPFKDGLFEVTIESTHPLANGDGLKFFDGDVEKASLGVGNPKALGKNLYSFVTKTAVKQGWAVNLTLDSEEEKIALARERKVEAKLFVRAKVGEPLEIKATSIVQGKSIEFSAQSGNLLEKATNAPTNKDEIAAQCTKVADSGFKVNDIEIKTDGVFLPKSVVNGVRRNAFAGLKEAIISFNEMNVTATVPENVEEAFKNIDVTLQSAPVKKCQRLEAESGSLMIKKGEQVVFAPDDYHAEAVKKSLEEFDLKAEEVLLQLPIIANGEDLKIVEDTLKKCKFAGVVSENLWGLYFADRGFKVVAGAGHNIANRFAVQEVKALGATAYVSSVEFEQDGGLERLKIEEELPLMTFAHCPFKTLYACECSKCAYKRGLIIKRERHEYRVRRIRLSKCYFQLFEKR